MDSRGAFDITDKVAIGHVSPFTTSIALEVVLTSVAPGKGSPPCPGDPYTVDSVRGDLENREVFRMVSTLELVCEHKICDLMPGDQSDKRWEASGVLVKDRHYFVVFDDRTEIARISDDLQSSNSNGLFGKTHKACGYEGITYNTAKQRFYLLVESRKQSRGCYNALIVEYDDEFRYLKERPVDFPFDSGNKGFEAVAHVHRNGVDYLLALCEGNKCLCGKKGRKPGGGRVQLFEKKKKNWKHVRAIELPSCLPFVDYSGMSIDDGRVAIVSQENSMLWVGQFNEADWAWRDAGQLYEFPRSDDGAIRYGNIEGVGWLTPTRIVAVSDRRKKKDQPDKRLSKTDQSVHIFDIPS
jgi:hypothetical protein